jgi:Sulfotransferase family
MMTHALPGRAESLRRTYKEASHAQTLERTLGGNVRRTLRLPDFFIVGHEKCGTTALYLMLRCHPQIFMSEIKEPKFFAVELRSRYRQLGPATRPETLEEYANLFDAARPGQRVGEATPVYLRSYYAAERIARLRPDAQLIVVLREPAAYLRSFHLQQVHNHTETETNFAKAIALEPSRRRGRRIPPFAGVPASLLYSDHVRYCDQLRRLHSAFPKEQVLVLIYDDFRTDNVATVRRVFRFLGVDDSWPVEPVETEHLKSVRALPLLQMRLAVSVARRRASRGGPALKRLDALMPKMPRTGAVGRFRRRVVYGEPPTPDEAFMLELQRRFKHEVVALSEYLGQDLVALWGYDRI